FIRPLILNITFLVLFVRNTSSGIRICVNFRDINNIFLKNRYPLLLIREILDIIYRVK
ncbi:hypothetical protein NEUTE2DRAFT_62539, partial [Neurospora tetrasperma FGSC 2509]